MLPAGTPSIEQGAIGFAYGEVNTVLTWTPVGDSTPQAQADFTYDLLKRNQTDLAFNTITDGEINPSGEPGVFLGFKAVDDNDVANGGLIGAWTCSESDTAFTLTLTGSDTGVVQVRFDELIDNFGCSAS